MARILGTVSSGYFVEPVYTLSQTFNTSGTYTVPAGKTQVAVFVMGGGGSGQGASTIVSSAGGSGAAIVAFKDYNVTAGTNYTVTVGGSNGTSSFGNIASASTVVGTAPVGASTANGGGGGRAMYYGDANQGYSGDAGASVTLSDANISATLTAGGGGGGGGAGGYSIQYTAYGGVNFSQAAGRPGGTGGGGGAGNGGAGGNQNNPGSGFGNSNSGSSGASGSANTGGGGGGGGGGSAGLAENPPPGSGEYYYVTQAGGGGGGAGGSGKVVVYVR